jgi:pyruvate decarboxylase
MEPGKISLGAYIFRRIRQLGINHVFGCPGDFNLNLLDHLYTVDDLEWVGTCNELNGAYAADGYARSRDCQARSSRHLASAN